MLYVFFKCIWYGGCFYYTRVIEHKASKQSKSSSETTPPATTAQAPDPTVQPSSGLRAAIAAEHMDDLETDEIEQLALEQSLDDSTSSTSVSSPIIRRDTNNTAIPPNSSPSPEQAARSYFVSFTSAKPVPTELLPATLLTRSDILPMESPETLAEASLIPSVTASEPVEPGAAGGGMLSAPKAELPQVEVDSSEREDRKSV